MALFLITLIGLSCQSQTLYQTTEEKTYELNEIVISVNNVAKKSKWKKYNKKSKNSDTWFLYLFPSEVILSSVEIQEPTELKIVTLN